MNRKPSWDLYSAALIFFALFTGVSQWMQLPRSIDAYYHLSVVQGFDRAGGWVGHSFWDYAPIGRPHLYPPVLHILMLGLKKLGVGLIDVARFFDALLGPMTLVALWVSLRGILSRRAAFFAVLIWSSTFSLYLASFLYPANSLALIFGLLALRHCSRGYWTAFAASVLLSIYSHGWTGWIILGAAVLHQVITAVFMEKRRPKTGFFAASLTALLLSTPLLYHLFTYRASFHAVVVAEDSMLDWSPAIYLLAFTGLALAVCFRKRWGILPILLWLMSLPLLFAHPWRFVSGHGMLAAVWLAAGTLDEIIRQAEIRGMRFKSLYSMVLAIIAFFFLIHPNIHYDRKSRTLEVQSPGSSLVRGILAPSEADPRLVCMYSPKRMPEIAQKLNECKAPNDIIWCNLDYPGAMLGALNNLATSTATLAEVRPLNPFNIQAAASLFVWFKEIDGSAPADLAEAVRRYSLIPQAETDMVLIYRNPNGGQAIVPQAILSTPILFGITGCLMGLAFLPFFKQRTSS